MRSPVFRFIIPRNRSRGALLLSLALVGGMAGCKPPVTKVEKTGAVVEPAKETKVDLVSQLAAARIDAARSKLARHRPDEALALLVSALKAAPASEEARALAETILGETVWNYPALEIDHKMPVDQVAYSAPSTLWVSLGGATNTTVRWNLDTLRIESVLFPVTDSQTRSLTFDPEHRWVVVERGGVSLLCDARSLKPGRDLGTLPDFLTPSSVVVFSRDGLLLAHPAFASPEDKSIVWHLRDTATGQIIRSSAADGAQPLAAYLNRTQLRVIRSDGSLMEMPISPVEEIQMTPRQEPVKLLQAQFSLDGGSALTIEDRGPHQDPVSSIVSCGNEPDGSLDAAALGRRFPWTRHPSLWTGLIDAPFAVDGGLVMFPKMKQAPVAAQSPVAAVALSEDCAAVVDERGIATVCQLLPLPDRNTGDLKPGIVEALSLPALERLCDAFAGIRFNEKERTFSRLSIGERVRSFGECDFDAVFRIFPGLDFSPLIAGFKEAKTVTAGPAALQPLLDRLARMKPAQESPGLDQVFQSEDSAAVLKAIQSSGAQGQAAARALALALESERPEWIETCLAQAQSLPPLLRQIARSRIAWLQGRKADALSDWPEVFPLIADIRLREDWDGWEQVDFQPALDHLRQCVGEELAAIKVPDNSTPEQRKAVATRLADPATIAAVGKRRFAEACLQAALAFSAHKEETETTFQLANLARDMGAPPAPCLRAEALALTALGDHANAHPRWIELITEHPVADTLPGDYAEAAYTAYENSDPRQAMEILTTGMHRFPQDGNFALRAGWVALLTGNPDRAYQFLLTGQRIGFPEEKIENATALLTIAAAQTGAADDASVYFQDLLDIDPAWADVATVDSLDWPEELKVTLAQFLSPGIIMPDP